MVSGLPYEILLRARETRQEVDRQILHGELGNLREVPDGGKGRATSRLYASQW